ncbi:MAG: lytic transglycosylase domain-containing protein, partial [Novosphingobium sp.]
MSRMDVKALILRWGVAGVLLQTLAASSAVHASSADGTDGADWDRARANLVASQGGPMMGAVERWKLLTSSNRFGFSDYSTFVLTYPGFPDEEKLRRFAEGALEREPADASRLVSYFDRKPPLTNPGRAQYALALMALGRPEARESARAAWRGGAMTDAAESALLSAFGPTFTLDDHDARMDALLWSGATDQAARQLVWVSPARKAIDAARLSAMQGTDPYVAFGGMTTEPLNSDPGFVFQRVRQLRKSGQGAAARAFLASRPLLARQPLDREKW